MGNFSGWLQRTENSAVNNALSRLVTNRTVKNKDVLNSFSSLLGNYHLMGYSEHKKNPISSHPCFTGEVGSFWAVQRQVLCRSLLPSVAVWLRASSLRGFARYRQTFSSACAAAELRMCWEVAPLQGWHLEPSLSWQCWGHCCRSGDVLQSDAP